jgi:hypothetical protein
MARKTVLVCDNCGREVGEGKGATLRQLRRSDARPRGCAERPQAEVGFGKPLAHSCFMHVPASA